MNSSYYANESNRQDVQTETECSLTASHLLEYLFCPRFTYFEYVLDIPQHEESRYKVEVGRLIHEKIRKMNPAYLRKKLGVKEKKAMPIWPENPASGALLMKFSF